MQEDLRNTRKCVWKVFLREIKQKLIKTLEEIRIFVYYVL